MVVELQLKIMQQTQVTQISRGQNRRLVKQILERKFYNWDGNLRYMLNSIRVT